MLWPTKTRGSCEAGVGVGADSMVAKVGRGGGCSAREKIVVQESQSESELFWRRIKKSSCETHAADAVC